MEIKVGFEIAYAAEQPTPMAIMLSIHPSRRRDIIGTETIVAEPRGLFTVGVFSKILCTFLESIFVLANIALRHPDFKHSIVD